MNDKTTVAELLRAVLDGMREKNTNKVTMKADIDGNTVEFEIRLARVKRKHRNGTITHRLH